MKSLACALSLICCACAAAEDVWTNKVERYWAIASDMVVTHEVQCPAWWDGTPGIFVGGGARWRHGLIPKSEITGVRITREGQWRNGYRATIDNHGRYGDPEKRLAVVLIIAVRCRYEQYDEFRLPLDMMVRDAIDWLLDEAIAQEIHDEILQRELEGQQ